MAFVFLGKGRMNAAISAGDVATMRHLLDKKLKPGLTDEFGDSFLMNAIYANKPAAVALLLERGADTAYANGYGSLLHLAATKGNLSICEMLVKADPSMLKKRDRSGETPLHGAAEYGHEDVAVFLLHNGVDHNAKNDKNRTALFLAQSKNHTHVVRLLEKLPKPEPVYALPAAAQDAPPAALPPPAVEEGWRKISDTKIALVEDAPAIGYRVTEIFNFAARERTTLYRNLETGAESVAVKGFDAITEKAPIEAALHALKKQGGAAGIAGVDAIDKPAMSRKNFPAAGA